MDPNDEITVAEAPTDLKGTALDRREFIDMLKVGGTMLLGTSLAGCSGNGGNGTDGGAVAGGVTVPEELVIALPSGPDLLDPHQTTDNGASYVMALLYDSMVQMDGDRNIRESLGKGYEISDDGTEWTIEFNVDSGITYHNGDEFTVDDVVFTFERLRDQSLIPWAVGSLQNVEKVDDRRVTFQFEKPYAFFDIHTAYSSYFGILPEDLAGASKEEFAQNPVGTGPYRLEEWVKDEHLTLARNDDYETPVLDVVEADDPPRPKRIVFQVIPSTTPRTQGLLTGDVDVVLPAPTKDRAKLQESDEAAFHSFSGTSIRYLAPHNGLPPTDDRRVRQAIAHAIDRERIVDDIYKGAGEVNYSPMPVGQGPWAGETVLEEIGYEYDPDKSRQLLEDAGWEQDGDSRAKDGKRLKLSMVTGNAPQPLLQSSEEIVAMLGEVGFDVDLTTTQSNQASVQMAQGETNLLNTGLGWGTPDVMQFMLASPYAGASNVQFFKDDKTDQYLNEAASTLDDAERANIYEKMQLRVMELCGTIPIMSPSIEIALSSKLGGYHYLEGSTGHMWSDIYVKDE
ncbi:ABC transporter substrate-binding protein [Haladaptatus sp. CMAA 1911]|uniref:ABC transporter substrate-binding protein n=1 Tax=unclassified Haladaptatus TaxID=2622732 RepID=UPI0037542720